MQMFVMFVCGMQAVRAMEREGIIHAYMTLDSMEVVHVTPRQHTVLVTFFDQAVLVAPGGTTVNLPYSKSAGIRNTDRCPMVLGKSDTNALAWAVANALFAEDEAENLLKYGMQVPMCARACMHVCLCAVHTYMCVCVFVCSCVRARAFVLAG